VGQAALPDDSSIREMALKCFFLRQAGYSDAEIGPMVNLKPVTIAGYIYKAGRNGWLDEWLDSETAYAVLALSH
jgi:hypothetical protein